MRLFFASLLLAFSIQFVTPCESADPDKPNILFIAIDDLNDWVSPLGGHPQAVTPNFQRLADRGTTFTNAHCQSPLCNPSRTSLMNIRTGRWDKDLLACSTCRARSSRKSFPPVVSSAQPAVYRGCPMASR